MRILILLLLTGCSGKNLLQNIKPTVDGKIAIILKQSQLTTCKRVEYKNGQAEYLCLELYRNGGKRSKFAISEKDWLNIKKNFGLYSHTQVSDLLTKLEYLCEQDLVKCEEHFETLDVLKEFSVKGGLSD